MKSASARQSAYPPKHFQYDTAPVDTAFSPLTSHASTIAEARALVSRAEIGLPIRRPPPSLQNPTRPETPAVNRRNSAFNRSGSAQSTSSNSLSFGMLSPLHTPLSSRPVSVDRWSRATSSSSASRGRVEREEAEEGEELPGFSEWEEVRPKTAAVASRGSLLAHREEEAESVETEKEQVEEMKEQLDEGDRDVKEFTQHGYALSASVESEKINIEAEIDNEKEALIATADEQTEPKSEEAEGEKEAIQWHKPVLSYVETDKTDHEPVPAETEAAAAITAAIADSESDAAQREEEEKEQSSLDAARPTPSAIPHTDDAPLPHAAPSPRLLDETLISLVYLASKLRDDPTSLSDSQLDHIYSLAASCLSHLTSAASSTELAAAFLPLRPASDHHLQSHCPLIVSILSALFTLSRQPENDELLWPILPLLLLPPAVLPSKQTLMCLFSLLVNATMSEEGAKAVACTEWMEWLLQRTADELNQPTDGGQVDAQMEEKRVTVCVEVTAIMRNLACAPQAHRLFIEPLSPSLLATQSAQLTATLSPRSPPTPLDRLCLLLLRFPSQASLALNVLRILSKLSLHAACRVVLDRQVECMEAMVGMLYNFHGKLALCIRVCFTLGNLTMTNADNRFVIADAIITTADATSGTTASTDGLSVILSLLHRTHQRNKKLLALLSSSSASSAAAPASSKHRLMLRENLDLLVKLIRLCANLAIHHDVGRRLVEDNRAAVLIDVLRDANERHERSQAAAEAVEAADGADDTQPSTVSTVDDEKTEELILNAISCMTNLSYYTTPLPSTPPSTSPSTAPTFLSQPLSSTLPLLTPHLLSSNRDTLTSLLRWLGNVSRCVGARRVLYDGGVDEAVVVLLSHGSGEVVEVCCGVVLNCSVDQQWADDKLVAEPTNLLRLVDAADGDEEDDDQEEQEHHDEGVDASQQSEAAVDDSASRAVSVQQAAEDEQRKWRLRSLIGKILCNLRRQQQQLQLDDEVIQRIESSVNEWTMELNDRVEESADETDTGRSAAAVGERQSAASIDEAELLSVFDAVLASCSH